MFYEHELEVLVTDLFFLSNQTLGPRVYQTFLKIYCLEKFELFHACVAH